LYHWQADDIVGQQLASLPDQVRQHYPPEDLVLVTRIQWLDE